MIFQSTLIQTIVVTPCSLTRTLALTALLGMGSSLQAGEFSYPQGVYNGEPVTNVPAANGGIVNQNMLEGMALTTVTDRPRIIEVTDGVWTLAGYYFVYPTIIEGDTGLIIFDTGDDVIEGQGVLDLARQVSDKPVSAIIYSHAHYVWGAKPMVAAGKNVKVIGHEGLNKNIQESGGLGSAIPELAPVLLARAIEQFSVLLPDEGPDAKASCPTTHPISTTTLWAGLAGTLQRSTRLHHSSRRRRS